MIEHHKENYEAEVAALEDTHQPPVVSQPSSSSSSDWSSGSDDEDGSSFLSSDDLMGVDTEMTTPTIIPEINFDLDMDVECIDDKYYSSDEESTMSSQ